MQRMVVRGYREADICTLIELLLRGCTQESASPLETKRERLFRFRR